MDDLSAKITELLNDPESLNKLKGLSGLLGQDFDKNQDDEKNKSESKKPDIPIDAMNTAMKLMPLLSSMNKDDDNTRFLMALRPLLSEERKKKLDQSIRMMKMMKLMPLLKNQELFL